MDVSLVKSEHGREYSCFRGCRTCFSEEAENTKVMSGYLSKEEFMYILLHILHTVVECNEVHLHKCSFLGAILS